MTREILEKKLDSLSNQKRYFGTNQLLEVKENIDGIIRFIDKNRKATSVEKIAYQFDLYKSHSIGDSFESDINRLRDLETLGFISTPQIVLKKSDIFEFDNASSGEKHFLFTMLNLISFALEDSLILIDEPELSMHPAWQMKYIQHLKEILINLPGCHCVLATHSHLMVADLEQESSNIVILKTSSSKVNPRSAEYVEHSTLAWSAENILYKVFQLRTSRNYYFGQEIAELLGLISDQSKDKDRLIELLIRFENLVLDKYDPLNEIIEQAKIYVSRLT